jgi:hypothetical protein
MNFLSSHSCNKKIQGDLSDLEIWWLLFAACSTSLPAARSIVGKKIEASQLRPDVFSRVFASIPGALPGYDTHAMACEEFD